MADEAPPTRMARAQQFLMYIGRRQVDPGIALLAPDATYRVPGNHALGGVFTGRQEIARHLTALFERTGGTFDTYKWDDWMLGEHHVAALADVHVQTRGHMYRSRHLFLVRFDVDDQIAEITVFFEDLAALAQLIGE
jgi:ketosteroid isomerase-like protein